MKRHSYFFFCMCLLASCLILTAAARGLSEELPVDSAVQGDGSAALAHFETHVRPLLIKRCQSCHSAADDTLEGGLALDSRAGWQEGGDSGPAVVPDDPEASLKDRTANRTFASISPVGTSRTVGFGSLLRACRVLTRLVNGRKR